MINKFTEKDLKDLFLILSEHWNPDNVTTNWLYQLTWLFIEEDSITYPKGKTTITAKQILRKYKLVSSDELYDELGAKNTSSVQSFWALFLSHFRKIMFEVPLDQLPLHINNPFEHVRITVAWRMERGV